MIFFRENVFENIVCKMAAIVFRSGCINITDNPDRSRPLVVTQIEVCANLIRLRDITIASLFVSEKLSVSSLASFEDMSGRAKI